MRVVACFSIVPIPKIGFRPCLKPPKPARSPAQRVFCCLNRSEGVAGHLRLPGPSPPEAVFLEPNDYNKPCIRMADHVLLECFAVHCHRAGA